MDQIFGPAFVMGFVVALFVGTLVHSMVYLGYTLPCAWVLPKREQFRLRLATLSTLAAAIVGVMIWQRFEASRLDVILIFAISLATCAHAAWATRDVLLSIAPILGALIAIICWAAGGWIAAWIGWHVGTLILTIIWRVSWRPPSIPPIVRQV